MVQLILDTDGLNVVMPETKNEAYNIQTEDNGVSVKMVSGRVTKEIRGGTWVISYQYGYFSDIDKDSFIAACEKGVKQPISCAFLIPESNQIGASKFWVESFKRPTFMWGKDDKPMWGDYSVSLREEKPHD